MNSIPIDWLRELVRPDYESGKLYWLARDERHMPYPKNRRHTRRGLLERWNGQYAGKEALTVTTKEGYRRGRIDGVELKAHRVLWALYYGEWPDGVVDHINGDRGDNRVENLRCVSVRENARNKWNISEHGVNVYYRRPWSGGFTVDGVFYSTGFKDTREEVVAALANLEEQHLPESEWWYKNGERPAGD